MNIDSQQKSDVELIRLSRLFDDGFYRAQILSDPAYGSIDPILHYIMVGERKGLRPNPLFDPSYYRLQASLTVDGYCYLIHYINEGWRQGYRTHPLFDTAYYLRHNPDVVEVGKNPLLHFLAQGGAEGRKPHPLFHSWDYNHRVPGLLDTKENPLVHYLQIGWRTQRHPHPLFDSSYYRFANNLIDLGGLTPLEHFITIGLASGLTPNPLFSPDAFRRAGGNSDRLEDETTIQAACLEPRSSHEDYESLRPAIALDASGVTATRTTNPDSNNNLRVIAFYLPQFHPIPENDESWGNGFTEWVNVRRAKPNFVGHDQPREPTELGYYDLRDSAVMPRQADLAAQYGIHGFCYYWYWFNGHKPLAMPLDRMLATGSPDFPFCLCWANETWTRKWANDETVVLQQTFSEEDDLAHATELARYMRDPRYITIGGAPLLLIYRAGNLPELPSYLNQWREIFAFLGIRHVHFALVESAEYAWAGKDPRAVGFDSAVEFPPHGGSGALPTLENMLNPSFAGTIFDYRTTALRYAGAMPVEYPRWRTVMAGWDNTARYQDSPAIFMNATPGGYGAWLETVLRDTIATKQSQEQLVFINAWNEWGEGTYLEPDVRWGRSYLEATLNAVTKAGKPQLAAD